METVKTRQNTTKKEYIACVKWELCKLLGYKDGDPCDRNGCLEADICSGCNRKKGILGEKPVSKAINEAIN